MNNNTHVNIGKNNADIIEPSALEASPRIVIAICILFLKNKTIKTTITSTMPAIETEYDKHLGAFQVPYRCLPGAISGALQVLFQVPSWCLTGVLPGAFQVLFRCLPGAKNLIH